MINLNAPQAPKYCRPDLRLVQNLTKTHKPNAVEVFATSRRSPGAGSASPTLISQAPAETQGLESIKGSVLVIADVENLSYGLHQANSDNQILLGAGVLAETVQAEVLILATGVGDLACSLAAFFKSRSRAPQVVTASLAGATSWRLYASENPDINGNIVLGRECMATRVKPKAVKRTGNFLRLARLGGSHHHAPGAA